MEDRSEETSEIKIQKKKNENNTHMKMLKNEIAWLMSVPNTHIADLLFGFIFLKAIPVLFVCFAY